MMIPSQKHHLVKISHSNRIILLRIALCFSCLGCTALFVATTTNTWLYTSERLKYYSHPNTTVMKALEDEEMEKEKREEKEGDKKTHNKPRVYFKNATIGPWLYCFVDPATPWNCRAVRYFTGEEAGDTTESIELSVEKSVLFVLLAVPFHGGGLVSLFISNFRHRSYRLLLCAGLLHIFAGMMLFLCLIVYVACLSKEVGKKMYPTQLDDPLYHYTYGYGFAAVMICYLCAEMAALFVLMVYMAKHDERMYNRYHIRGLFKSSALKTTGSEITKCANKPPPAASLVKASDRYYEHSRWGTIKRRRSSVWSGYDTAITIPVPSRSGSSSSSVSRKSTFAGLPTVREERLSPDGQLLGDEGPKTRSISMPPGYALLGLMDKRFGTTHVDREENADMTTLLEKLDQMADA